MMQQDLIEIRERKICEDRCTNFRGTASVRLELLDFVDFDGFDVEESSDAHGEMYFFEQTPSEAQTA